MSEETYTLKKSDILKAAELSTAMGTMLRRLIPEAFDDVLSCGIGTVLKSRHNDKALLCQVGPGFVALVSLRTGNRIFEPVSVDDVYRVNVGLSFMQPSYRWKPIEVVITEVKP